MLIFLKYNSKLTNPRMIPDKNKENTKWKQYFKDNVDIESYSESYSFLSNRKLSSYDKISDDDGNLFSIYQFIKNNGSWYTSFGSNWVAQIQVYHHILNQRVMFVTGATGVGKSTTFPFVTLYGHKMLFFNNRFVFSSEIKSILSLGFPRKVSKEGFKHTMVSICTV